MNIEGYYRSGVQARLPAWLKTITIVSWDMGRNHFAKAYAVAEALADYAHVELVSFNFFGDEIFKPLSNREPRFQLRSFRGQSFPGVRRRNVGCFERDFRRCDLCY